jgi:hypothetical protein
MVKMTVTSSSNDPVQSSTFFPRADLRLARAMSEVAKDKDIGGNIRPMVMRTDTSILAQAGASPIEESTRLEQFLGHRFHRRILRKVMR